MKFGLFSINMDSCSDPETARQIAQFAEAAGFESLWAGEHIVLPDPQIPSSPMAPQDRILDPVVSLTFLAAHTSQIRLGTGIIIIPQRNPLVLAKELASLDVLSGGRLLFGAGVGYLEPEFHALGVPFTDRGARTDDYLAAMSAILTQQKPEYHGRFFAFEGVQAHPQRQIPLVIGGHSSSSYRRAVEVGNGWYGFALDLDGTARALAGLKEAQARTHRRSDLGDLEISVTPSTAVTLQMVKQFADLGVHRLIVRPRRYLTQSALRDYIAQVADTLIGQG